MKRITILLLLVCLACGCATSAQKRTRKRMEAIRIPEMDLRQADVYQVMDFLHEQSVEYDPATRREDRVGISTILYLTPTEEESKRKPPTPFSAPQHFGPVISFHATNISLLDAFDAVSRVSGIKYRIDRKGIVHFKRENPTK